jgi:hypothetical protein
MLAHLRFRLYRWLLGTFTAKGFKRHKVWPLELPSDDHLDAEPLSAELPRLFGIDTFPRTEHAISRAREVRLRGRLLPLVRRIPAQKTSPIATDLPGLLDEIYPARYRKLWPQPPIVPPELEADDILAALAVGGPFAMYLQKASTLDAADRDVAGVRPDDFVIDMRIFDRYVPKAGLLAPGGLAIFRVDGDHLRTRGIRYENRLHEPGDGGFDRARRVLLCALNTHLNTLVHNVTVHLAYVTPMAVASTNELPTDHPIRRLLHPAFHTALVGNYELAKFQIVGPRGFATTLFSHEYPTLVHIINDYLERFRPADLDPEVAVERRGLDGATIALPFWDDQLALWRIARDYVDAYVGNYYADDAAVADDPELHQWLEALDRLFPSGLYDDHGYLTAGAPLTRAMLARVCATVLHTSSTTHDVVNNAVWDYSTLNHVVPTVVPESLEPQDVRLSFDLMNTIIGTWKPYNMLIDGVSVLALDEDGRRIMDGYVKALVDRQKVMDTEAHQAGRTYPNELNPSVSN